MNINIAILEDNPSDYINLQKQINKWADKTSHTISIIHFPNANALLDYSKNIDLLFSDIELEKDSPINGLVVCKMLRKKGYTGEIVFLTAFSEYVFDGYEARAFNYLLKPISEDAASNCMEKYVALHANDYYYHHSNSEIIQIPYNDIICINREINNIVIQTRTGLLYYERVALSEIEKRLPTNFMRCHKSSIINMNHVLALKGTEIQLSNKLIQTAGRAYLDGIRKALLNLASK